ncbi:Hypothetical predicted protein [Paramuricea clavata]|uniref:Uncharacterized protein n=1 Tax=Paramuricea clavata TaxID=317549 RepID=A0A7D9K0W5_PARCT|nr:Hypothetical predicted protein [Paramuricea clavata]
MADMNSEMRENEIVNPSVQSVTKTKSNKKKKNVYVFDNGEVEFLIYAWSKREVLYDSKNPDYFKKDAKLTAVNQLIEELGFEVLTFWNDGTQADISTRSRDEVTGAGVGPLTVDDLQNARKQLIRYV